MKSPLLIWMVVFLQALAAPLCCCRLSAMAAPDGPAAGETSCCGGCTEGSDDELAAPPESGPLERCPSCRASCELSARPPEGAKPLTGAKWTGGPDASVFWPAMPALGPAPFVSVSSKPGRSLPPRPVTTLLRLHCALNV